MNANEQIHQLAARQKSIYCLQPADLKSHYNHERSVVDSYRGRQLLELLQNADDAFDPTKRPTKLLFRLFSDCLVAANSGRPFAYEGIESLVVTDASPKQLHRTRCIGNKGLGFRSVLSWSLSPLVHSGVWSVAFSAEAARRNVEVLAKANENIGAVVQQWRAVRADLPAPIMRFPFVPLPDDVHLKLAREIMAEGFDTVIVLPFQEGEAGQRVRADSQIAPPWSSMSCYARSNRGLLLWRNHRSWHICINSEVAVLADGFRGSQGRSSPVLARRQGRILCLRPCSPQNSPE